MNAPNPDTVRFAYNERGDIVHIVCGEGGMAHALRVLADLLETDDEFMFLGAWNLDVDGPQRMLQAVLTRQVDGSGAGGAS